MSDLRVARGANKAETLAIEGWLGRMGLELDPKTRTIKEESIAKSKVEGGRAALEKALRGHAELDLDMLVQVPMRQPGDRFKEIVKAHAKGVVHDVAVAHLKAFPGVLKSTADELKGFVEYVEADPKKLNREQFFTALSSVLRRVNHAAKELDKFDESGALSVATSDDIRNVKVAYADLFAAAGAYGKRLDAIFRGEFMDRTSNVVTNLRDSFKLMWTRDGIAGQHRSLAESLGKIAGAAQLFSPHEVTGAEIGRAFEQLARTGDRSGFSPDVIRYTAATALNTVQQLFTNEFNNDEELKRLVAQQQRDNAVTFQARPFAEEVLGRRSIRDRQLDSLRVIVALFSGDEHKGLREEAIRKLDSMSGKV